MVTIIPGLGVLILGEQASERFSFRPCIRPRKHQTAVDMGSKTKLEKGSRKQNIISASAKQLTQYKLAVEPLLVASIA